MASCIALEESSAARSRASSSFAASKSWSSCAPETTDSRDRVALFRGPRGRMMKKLTTIIAGRQADARRVVRTLKPNDVVASAYAPAPIRPAPPVSLPQAARLNG